MATTGNRMQNLSPLSDQFQSDLSQLWLKVATMWQLLVAFVKCVASLSLTPGE